MIKIACVSITNGIWPLQSVITSQSNPLFQLLCAELELDIMLIRSCRIHSFLLTETVRQIGISILFYFQFWRTSVLFMGFKARVDSLDCRLRRLCAMNSKDSSLVLHLLTFWIACMLTETFQSTYLHTHTKIFVEIYHAIKTKAR